MACVFDGDNLLDPATVIAASKVGDLQLWVVAKMQNPCAPFTLTFDSKAKRNTFYDAVVAAMSV